VVTSRSTFLHTQYVSDRIAIMFRGNIVEMGPVEQVLMQPKHPYTKLLRESIEVDPSKRWGGGQAHRAGTGRIFATGLPVCGQVSRGHGDMQAAGAG